MTTKNLHVLLSDAVPIQKGRETMTTISKKLAASLLTGLVTLTLASQANAAIDSTPPRPSAPHSYPANPTATNFSLTDIQPAGSGIFGPIVRIKRDDSEQGYNVDFGSTNDNSTMDVAPLDHSPVTNPV